jgi:hypothetical protein
MTTWLFDLGNTRLKCAPLQDGLPGGVIEATHDGENFVDGWDARLPDKIDTAFVSSVASTALTATLLDTLTQRSTRISLARTQRECDGVRIAYGIPAHLGVDRFLALLAAHSRAREPWLVVGVGTAWPYRAIADADARGAESARTAFAFERWGVRRLRQRHGSRIGLGLRRRGRCIDRCQPERRSGSCGLRAQTRAARRRRSGIAAVSR